MFLWPLHGLFWHNCTPLDQLYLSAQTLLTTLNQKQYHSRPLISLKIRTMASAAVLILILYFMVLPMSKCTKWLQMSIPKLYHRAVSTVPSKALWVSFLLLWQHIWETCYRRQVLLRLTISVLSVHGYSWQPETRETEDRGLGEWYVLQ